MARATDGATGSAISKPARMPQARPAGRRMAQLWTTTVQFLQSVAAEMKRVVWPDQKTLIASSVVVVFVMVVTALYLAGLDYILARVFQAVLKF